MARLPYDPSASFYVEIYSNYDIAVMDWLSSVFKFKQDKPLEKVFATPDRAWAQMKDKFSLSTLQEVPLPFGSLSQTNWVIDLARYSYRDARIIAYSDGDSRVHGYERPVPVNIGYQFHIWSKIKKHLDWFTNQWLRNFAGTIERFITVPHTGSLFGDRLVPVLSDSIDDSSNIEPGLEGPTFIRIFSFTVGGWVTRDDFVNGVVKKIYHEIRDENETVACGTSCETVCEECCEAHATENARWLETWRGSYRDEDDPNSPYDVVNVSEGDY